MVNTTYFKFKVQQLFNIFLKLVPPESVKGILKNNIYMTMSRTILIICKLFVFSLNKKIFYIAFIEGKPPKSNELNARHTYIPLVNYPSI